MLIAHLSDLHLSRKFKPENIDKTKRIIERGLEEGVEHFVFTGDISDNADPSDYKIFRSILNRFDLLNAEKSTVVIGNHDIFGGVQTAMDVVNFPSKCKALDYDKKVEEFVGFFSELFDKTYFPIKDKFFPFAKKIEDIVFIGLNSIDRYSNLKNPFASNGRVCDDQVKGLLELENHEPFLGLKKVLLIHHHFYKKNVEAVSSHSAFWNRLESWTLKLRGKKKLMRHLNRLGINLVLHGHSHELKEYYRKEIKFLNAGAGIDNGDRDSAKLIIVDTGKESYSTRTINTVAKSEDLSHKVAELNMVASIL